MTQIAVAVLQVQELEAELPGEAGGANVIGDDAADLVVSQERVIRRDTELPVEDRVVVDDARLEAILPVRPAEAAGVGKLEADEQVIGLAIPGAVRGE